MMYYEIMDHLQIAVLALVQGLTEFLPISSSGHLVLVPKLLGWQEHGLDLDAFLHLGTLVAVLVYFYKDLVDIVLHKRHLGIAIIIGTLPAVLLGFGAKTYFSSEAVRSVASICVTLILGSVLMIVADVAANARTEFKNSQDLKILDIFWIGCAQALALFPGVSRSGASISAGLFTGLSREDAARFSFLLGVPAIAGAGLLALKDMAQTGVQLDYSSLGLGFIVSAISGYLAIDFLIKFLKTQSLRGFVIYRVVLAGLLYFYFN